MIKLVFLLYIILILYLFNKKEKIRIINIVKTFFELNLKKKIISIIIVPILFFLSFIFNILVYIIMVNYIIFIVFNINKKIDIEIPKLNINDDMYILNFKYVKFITILKILFKNIYNKIKKYSFLRIYFIFNKNKKMDISMIENIFFKLIFKMYIISVENFLTIIINFKTIHKNKSLKIRIIILFKKFLKDICIITLDNDEFFSDFKIKIDNFKIKTNGIKNGIDRLVWLSNCNKNPQIKILSEVYIINNKSIIKEHIIMTTEENKNVSLTRSKEVKSYILSNGERKIIKTKTNLLYSLDNDKKQYGLMYNEVEGFKNKFLTSDDCNSNLLNNFNILNEKSFIGFYIKTYFSIINQKEWNVLDRGNNIKNYLYLSNITNQDGEYIYNKIKNMSNLEVYEYVNNKITMNDLFVLQRIYYIHFKKINYLTEKEIENNREKKILYNKNKENIYEDSDI